MATAPARSTLADRHRRTATSRAPSTRTASHRWNDAAPQSSAAA
uniref:Uncharacterized protein n=1 Tax=Arundo donax TaxID=35708 RepID=A0A0A9F9I9_ARUDO